MYWHRNSARARHRDVLAGAFSTRTPKTETLCGRRPVSGAPWVDVCAVKWIYTHEPERTACTGQLYLSVNTMALSAGT